MCLEYVLRSSGHMNAVSDMFLCLFDRPLCFPLRVFPPQHPNLQKNETSKKTKQPQAVTGYY